MPDDYGLSWAETVRDRQEPPEPLYGFEPEENNGYIPEEPD